MEEAEKEQKQKNDHCGEPRCFKLKTKYHNFTNYKNKKECQKQLTLQINK